MKPTVLCVLLGSSGGLNGLATAALQDCDKIEQIASYKVVLDEFVDHTGGAAAPDDQEWLGLLVWEFEGYLEAIEHVSVQSAQLAIVPCENRTPTEADFSTSEVEYLNQQDVLVELWGRLKDHKARVGFAVIPISYYAPGSSPSLGIKQTEYEEERIRDPERLVARFGETTELEAYVTGALGLKQLKNHHYDGAFDSLCASQRALAPLPDNNDHFNRLRIYIKALLAETIETAINDPAYNNGKLTQVPSENPCLGGGA